MWCRRMGGSAIAGDIARSVLASELVSRFTFCRHYALPEYVDDETLCDCPVLQQAIPKKPWRP